MKTAVVTGASGFLGRHWTPFLEARGVRVSALRRGPEMSDAAALDQALRDAGPDVVFHLAGVAETQDVSEYYRTNAVLAANLFASMQRVGLTDRLVVLMGTSAEYGPGPGDTPLDEDAPCRPQSHYGISKLAQTLMGQAMARAGRRVLVVRPSNLVGPGMPGHLAVQQFAEQIQQATRSGSTRTIATGDLSVVRDFIDVEDVCVRLWALCQAEVPSGEIVNVASGRGVALREVVERLVALAGGGIEIRTDPVRLRPNDLRAHVSSTAKLERLVHPPLLKPLDDTLRRVLAWQPDTIARR